MAQYLQAAGVAAGTVEQAVPELIQITRVDRPLEDLATLLGHRPADWLASFASIAAHAGESAAERVAPARSKARRRSKAVNIELADLPPDDDFARVDAAVDWRTAGFRWVFTSFRGRITAVRETDETCIVTLEGTYDPASARTPALPDPSRLAAEAAAEMLLGTLRAAVEEQVRSDA